MISAMPTDITGVQYQGVFWYFHPEITPATIASRLGRIRGRGMLRTLAYAGALLGVGAVIVDFALYQGQGVVPIDVYFTSANPAFVALGAGVMSGLFGAYLSKMPEDEHALIARSKHEEVPEVVTVGMPPTGSRDIATVFSADAWQAIEDALVIADTAQAVEVNAEHVITAALSSVSVRTLLARLGLPSSYLKDPLAIRMQGGVAGEAHFSEAGRALVAQAFALAARGGRKQVTALDLFAASFAADEFTQEIFADHAVTASDMEHAIAWLHISDELVARYKAFRAAAAFKPTGNLDRAMTAVATPFLDAVSEDVTRQAVYGRTALLVGRDQEMANMLRAIEGGEKSVVLVGQPGSGKSALIDGLADLMVEERVPRQLADKRLLRLSVPHIISSGQGSADERFLYALREAARAGNVIIVIENVHELVGAGGSIDLASVLVQELSRGYTFAITTTTPEAYANVLERSVLGPALSRVDIGEPLAQDAIRILEAKVGAIEAKHQVIFTYAAVASVVDFATRYLHDVAMPQSAIELAKEVALFVAKRGQKLAWITKEDVAELVSQKAKVNVTTVTQDEGQKLLHLEEQLHARVIGQEHAVKAVSSALRRARAKLRSDKRPIAAFLFLGPTGVGKTELAKTTAEVFFGNENAMLRFDMSEYQDATSSTRLVGGNSQAGLLTEAVRRSPYSLILLDELEKAHPDVLNLFLQVLDDGRLTDGFGRTVDFTNAIIIATSNVGAVYIQDEVVKGTSPEALKEALVNGELRHVYRPEFLNRFDDLIVFTPLTREDVVAIAYLMTKSLAKRIEEQGMVLEITDAALHELAEAGYDPKFGARPLRRVMQERVENAVADLILTQQVKRRDKIVYDAGGQVHVVVPGSSS
ncbi:ATP-dependent Clp protease ATP-binding subunit [Patescibacteria group bacterium]|nr:ATP-dependent Clp protease ATP-binding subunit [Patescibacteria group bacterium]